MTNKINLEDEIIILSAETIHKLFSFENGSDVVALYLFYHKQCKIQGTNQSFTIADFAKKGLKWGDIKFRNAKKVLKELGLIEDVCNHSADGKISGWFIKLNYIRTTTTQNQGVVQPVSGFQETNAGSSLKINAGSSLKENTTSVVEISEAKKEYGNSDINIALAFLRKAVGITDFKESKDWQRRYTKNIISIKNEIGDDEFKHRLKSILQDDFKSKNCNKLKYLYEELKAFIHSPVVETSQNKVSSIIF